jgi:hypothetical protein
MSPVMSQNEFPDLSREAEDRATATFLMIAFVGSRPPSVDIPLYQMLFTFARLVDGVFLDYQAARESYFKYFDDTALGGSLPASDSQLS